VLAYHGTEPRLAVEIARTGIRKGERWHGQPPSVYFSTEPETAAYYGRFLTQELDDIHVIIEFEIPAGVGMTYEEIDDGLGFFDSFRIEQDVPLSWLKSVTIRGNRNESDSVSARQGRIIEATIEQKILALKEELENICNLPIRVSY
jgi:hypothetical protein